MNKLRNWFNSSNCNNHNENTSRDDNDNDNDNDNNMLSVSSSNYQIQVRSLQQMGFDSEMAVNALAAADGNVDEALEILLSSLPLDLPVQEQELPPLRSAPSVKAGQAALRRVESRNGSKATNKSKVNKSTVKRRVPVQNSSSVNVSNSMLSTPIASSKSYSNSNIVSSHLTTNLPTKISEKTLEEQVTRCVERLTPYPRTVETLLLTLSKLRNNPDNDTFRKLNASNAGFQRVITGVPGAEDLLRAVKYNKRKDSVFWVMRRADFDPALLWMAVSALEGAKQGKEYNDAKKIITFENEITKLLGGVGELSEDEIIERSNNISRIPTEPAKGQGALVQLIVGKKTLMRRFDGDDQVKDVLNWIGGHGTLLRTKLLSREWCVVDLNRYPSAPIAFDSDLEKTLQFIGFWPSGKLELRPSDDCWYSMGIVAEEMGQSRGLGAA